MLETAPNQGVMVSLFLCLASGKTSSPVLINDYNNTYCINIVAANRQAKINAKIIIIFLTIDSATLTFFSVISFFIYRKDSTDN
jgi:hypothetical protein